MSWPLTIHGRVLRHRTALQEICTFSIGRDEHNLNFDRLQCPSRESHCIITKKALRTKKRNFTGKTKIDAGTFYDSLLQFLPFPIIYFYDTFSFLFYCLFHVLHASLLLALVCAPPLSVVHFRVTLSIAGSRNLFYT